MSLALPIDCPFAIYAVNINVLPSDSTSRTALIIVPLVKFEFILPPVMSYILPPDDVEMYVAVVS